MSSEDPAADGLLEDPDGAPYPEQIQTLIRKLADEALDHGTEILTLVDIIEAARRLGPDPASTRRRLWLVYSSGITTGAATAAVNTGQPAAVAQRLGHAIAGLLAEDPLIREPLLDELVTLLETGHGLQEWRHVTAYRLQHPTD
jgi:hypothetical protein